MDELQRELARRAQRRNQAAAAPATDEGLAKPRRRSLSTPPNVQNSASTKRTVEPELSASNMRRRSSARLEAASVASRVRAATAAVETSVANRAAITPPKYRRASTAIIVDPASHTVPPPPPIEEAMDNSSASQVPAAKIPEPEGETTLHSRDKGIVIMADQQAAEHTISRAAALLTQAGEAASGAGFRAAEAAMTAANAVAIASSAAIAADDAEKNRAAWETWAGEAAQPVIAARTAATEREVVRAEVAAEADEAERVSAAAQKKRDAAALDAAWWTAAVECALEADRAKQSQEAWTVKKQEDEAAAAGAARESEMVKSALAQQRSIVTEALDESARVDERAGLLFEAADKAHIEAERSRRAVEEVEASIAFIRATAEAKAAEAEAARATAANNNDSLAAWRRRAEEDAQAAVKAQATYTSAEAALNDFRRRREETDHGAKQADGKFREAAASAQQALAEAAALASASALPAGWTEVKDPSGSSSYFFNSGSGETTTERPSFWRQVADPATGQTYWFNDQTQQSSWEKPKESETDLHTAVSRKIAAEQKAQEYARAANEAEAASATVARKEQQLSDQVVSAQQAAAATTAAAASSTAQVQAAERAAQEATASESRLAAEAQEALAAHPQILRAGWQERSRMTAGGSTLFYVNDSTGESTYERPTQDAPPLAELRREAEAATAEEKRTGQAATEAASQAEAHRSTAAAAQAELMRKSSEADAASSAAAAAADTAVASTSSAAQASDAFKATRTAAVEAAAKVGQRVPNGPADVQMLTAGRDAAVTAASSAELAFSDAHRVAQEKRYIEQQAAAEAVAARGRSDALDAELGRADTAASEVFAAADRAKAEARKALQDAEDSASAKIVSEREAKFAEAAYHKRAGEHAELVAKYQYGPLGERRAIEEVKVQLTAALEAHRNPPPPPQEIQQTAYIPPVAAQLTYETRPHASSAPPTVPQPQQLANKQAPLAKGWKEIDHASGTYWYNKTTRETTRIRPEAAAVPKVPKKGVLGWSR